MSRLLTPSFRFYRRDAVKCKMNKRVEENADKENENSLVKRDLFIHHKHDKEKMQKKVYDSQRSRKDSGSALILYAKAARGGADVKSERRGENKNEIHVLIKR